jgi:hypothetical protein
LSADRVNRWLTLVANLGVLIGLFLLVFEIRQNTELTRAQIAMERTNSTREIFSDWANGGELVPIEVKLFEQVEGFPMAVGWSSLLSPEELLRYGYRIRGRSEALKNDWYQCSLGLVEEEICRREVRVRMRNNLHRFYELGIPLGRSQQGYIDEMQDLAEELGLPTLGDDGRWSQ